MNPSLHPRRLPISASKFDLRPNLSIGQDPYRGCFPTPLISSRRRPPHSALLDMRSGHLQLQSAAARNRLGTAAQRSGAVDRPVPVRVSSRDGSTHPTISTFLNGAPLQTSSFDLARDNAQRSPSASYPIASARTPPTALDPACAPGPPPTLGATSTAPSQPT
jgi:hypothetical protein